MIGNQYSSVTIKFINKKALVMNNMIKNPFDINKAVDYTDDELYKYWVNINSPNGFNEFIKPDTLMPMIIEGSKGSGKTHVMKYYSYELQKIRVQHNYDKRLKEGFEKESFIGVYLRFSGMNSNVFAGQGLSDDVWEILFSYYWELFLGERILTKLIDMQSNRLLEPFDEKTFVEALLGLFLHNENHCDTLEGLRAYLETLQKSLQYEIHNFRMQAKERPNVDIKLPVSTLTYGIPNKLHELVPYFNNRHILYLFDEYENISEQQQQVIQTLLREKPTTCTIRIGTRPYGIRTNKTIGGIEENIEGSEFETKRLDDEIRNSTHYKRFMENICKSRLEGAKIKLDESKQLRDYIEELSDEMLVEKAKRKKSTYYVNKHLCDDLKKYKHQKLTDEDIDNIMRLVSFESDLIVERASIELLYKKIKARSTDLVGDAHTIHQYAEDYHNKKIGKDNHIATRLSYFKKDIVDGIARSAQLPIPYYGLDTLIELSCGTPRTLLRLLKHSFSKQYFNTGQAPFEEGRILSTESQRAGIENTYSWFFEENRIPNDESGVTDVVKRLGKYLQNVRFSDLPPQCSIDIFSVQEENLSPEARKSIQTLTLYSYLIFIGDRRKKNYDNKVSVYKLNTILIPKWELSLDKRGNVELTSEDAEMIFNPLRSNDYELYLKDKLKSYNFPFVPKSGKEEVQDNKKTEEPIEIIPSNQLKLFNDGL